MDIIYFIKALLRKKWLIVVSSVLAVVAAFFFTMGRPRLYVSNTQIATGLTVTDQIKLRDERSSIFETDVKFDNIIQTINSPVVLGLLSYDLLIHDLESDKPFRQLTQKQLNSEKYRTLNKREALKLLHRRLDSLQLLSSYDGFEAQILEFMKLYGYDNESIKKMLQVSRIQRTDYIDINFRSENPDLSAYVVNTLYTEFLRYYRSLRSERTVENIGTFQALVEQKKLELDKKVDSLRIYKASQGLLNVDVASGNELDLIKQFERTMVEEKANLNTLTSSLGNINRQLERLNSGKSAYNTDNSDIVALRRQINELNEEYQKRGGVDKGMEARLKDLRAQLQNRLSSVYSATGKQATREELTQRKGALEADIQAATQNINNLQAKIYALKGSLGSYANKEAMLSSLEKEVALAQDEYSRLKEKLNSALDNRSAPQDNFRQTLRGQPAFKPESSKRLIIMGLSGASVFFLLSFSILFLEFIDSSVKSPSIFEKAIDLKLLATVNHADLHKYGILEMLNRNLEDRSGKERIRQNTFRELLRKLRYELEHSGKHIFLLTSTEPQQGKTTLTQALAYSLSLSSRKVLIIDTNFCNNDLTVQLEAKPTLESISIAPGEFSIDRIRGMVTSYPKEGVEVIGCRGGDYTPSEILPENNLLQYLPELAKHHDFILLEGAPLNDYTDSKELSAYVDGVIVVFSSRLSLKQIDKESIQFLHSLGDRFVGAILNNVQEDYLEL